MNDLISRHKAIRLYCRENCGCEPEECPLTYEQDGTEDCSYIRFLKELPSVQPEQKHGKWSFCASAEDLICSNCLHYWIPNGDQYDFKYCPNCGARMDGETE